jgi:DivIVA domain-containing protein
MTWVFAILLVLAMGAIAMLAAGKGTTMAEVYDDRPDATVPADGPLAGDDLRRVRFSLAFRGYRMSEVDALLDRLASQLEGQVEGQVEGQLEDDEGGIQGQVEGRVEGEPGSQPAETHAGRRDELEERVEPGPRPETGRHVASEGRGDATPD